MKASPKNLLVEVNRRWRYLEKAQRAGMWDLLVIMKLVPDHTQFLQCKFNHSPISMVSRVQNQGIFISLILQVQKEQRNQQEKD